MAAKSDRIVLHAVHGDGMEGDGAYTEVYWARSADDMPEVWAGSILFHEDGSASFQCRSTDTDEPYVVHLIGDRIVVVNTEDVSMVPDPARIVFDSYAHAKAVS